MAELNEKQKRFVEEYCIDYNATQAAIRAGYSPKSAEVTACRLLRNAKICEAIDQKRVKIAEKAELSAEWVLRELARNHELAKGIGELAASNKALELIGKHLGMFKDKVEMTGENGAPLNVIFNIPRPKKGEKS